jgi:teichuronic acid biosynthesis glycosyltransferase TuaC
MIASFPSSDQPERCIFNLRAARQLQHFVDIEVIFPRAWLPGRKFMSQYEIEGIKVHMLAIPQTPITSTINLSLYQYLGWNLVRPFLKSCDIIHSVYADGPGILASLWARRAHKRHVMQIIGSDVNQVLENSKPYRDYHNWTNSVDGVICVSNSIAHKYKEMYPNSKNLRTIYRGADLKKFNPEGAVEGSIDRRNPVRFFYTGGFSGSNILKHGSHDVKGGVYLFEAWRFAEERLNSAGASLVLAGANSDSETMRKRLSKLKFPDMVHLAGSLDPVEIPNYMRASDVIVLPSLNEGLPNVGMEAMACGKAIIGSDVGGIPELVIEGETGHMVPPKNTTALAYALVSAANNPDLIANMGSKARLRATELLDNHNFAPAVVELYKEVLNDPI